MKTNLTRTLLTLGAAAALASAASAQEVRTELDGRQLNFDQPAMMQGGRVMVPLRGIFESLGAEVIYQGGRIKATKGSRVIELAVGSQNATINGQSQYLDTPASATMGRVMVPLRFVSEALGADVKWSSATRTVSLRSDGSTESVGSAPVDATPASGDPRITSLVHNGRARLQPGDQLIVTMSGDRGGEASFDILGVVRNVGMREVSPGRYEGELTITPQMTVRSGTLVGHLRVRGQESTMEGQRPVTLRGDDGNNGGNDVGGGNSQAFEVFPQPSSQVNSSRPTVQVNMGNRVQPSTARLMLDGNDVTGQVQFAGTSLTFVPNYDLSGGEHRVRVQALDQRGQTIDREWSFVSYNNNGSVYNPGNPNNGNFAPTLQLSNISSGATVPAVFAVQGQTAPFAQVQVTAEARRDLIPGWLSLENFRRVNSVQADGSGRFSVQVDASQVPARTPISLQVQANTPQGQNSGVTQLQVTRQ